MVVDEVIIHMIHRHLDTLSSQQERSWKKVVGVDLSVGWGEEKVMEIDMPLK